MLERSGLRIEHFCWEVILNRSVKKSLFFADFALQNMVETTLPNGFKRTLVKGYIANFGISLDVFELFHFGLFFSVF